jgi:hypothetical protein
MRARALMTLTTLGSIGAAACVGVRARIVDHPSAATAPSLENASKSTGAEKWAETSRWTDGGVSPPSNFSGPEIFGRLEIPNVGLWINKFSNVGK